jgi:hypothetical protein
MSGRGAPARRPALAEPATATRPRRDGSPYGHIHAGFSLGDDPGTRHGLLTEVPPR